VSDFSVLDYVALGWFLVGWLGYTAYADHSRWSKNTMGAAMRFRFQGWMERMLARDLRIVDTQIIGNLLTGIGFFASTTILVIGGLIAILGSAEQAMQALSELPFAVVQSREVWETKILVLLAVFVYAFFKFGWAFRIYNYCSIMIGAAPDPASAEEEEENAADYATRAAMLASLASRHFNRGLRAYFFALAVLGWFVSPLAFIAATTLVLVVLQRREFRSQSLKALRRE